MCGAQVGFTSVHNDKSVLDVKSCDYRSPPSPFPLPPPPFPLPPPPLPIRLPPFAFPCYSLTLQPLPPRIGSMRTLPRYASIEFLKVFLITLTCMTIFMFLVLGGREAVRKGLGPGPILRVMPYILPESMRYSIPAAALLAACTVYGRMACDNEVVATKSLGISPLVLIAPVLALSFLISVCAVWMNDISVSWGLPGRQRAVVESIEQIVYGMLRTQRSYKNDQFSITVKRVIGDQLISPRIVFRAEDGEQTIISAQQAHLRYDPHQIALVATLSNPTIEGPGFEGGIPRIERHVIPLLKDSDEPASASDFPLRDIGPQRYQQRLQIVELEKRFATHAAYAMLTGDLASLSDASWRDREQQLRQARYHFNRLRTEPWRRWANGFSCFFFVFVGVPLAIRLQSSDFMTSFFMSFLPILLVYYPAMMYGVDRAKEGALPQYAVWLGNFICLMWGSWLLRRVLRY